jgi:hypothetical protein
MSSKFKPVRVQASAIPAVDVPNYWLPALGCIDPNITPAPSCRAVIVRSQGIGAQTSQEDRRHGISDLESAPQRLAGRAR